MNFYFKLILYLLFVGCYNLESTKKVVINDCENFVDTKKWRMETLYIDSVKLHNEIFLYNSLEYYQNIFGKALNKYNINNEDICFYTSNEFNKVRYIFDGLVLDEIDNKAIVNTLNFSKFNDTLYFNALSLSYNTSVKDVCMVFPESCKLISMDGNLWSGFIELKITQLGLDSRRVFLIFRGEKLIKLKIINLGFDEFSKTISAMSE